jgi:hypothetical protein
MHVLVLNPGSNTTFFMCQDVDLQAACGDEDGCRIRFMMQHKTHAQDEFRVAEALMGMETPAENGGRAVGIFGWINLSSSPSEFNFISGNGSTFVAANPYNAVYMITYRSSNCAGGDNAILPAYNFRFMADPLWRARILVWDN